MDLESIKSALWKANGETLFSGRGDVKTLIVRTLIRIIKMFGHEETLSHIIKSTEDGGTVDDLMESGGDVDTLIVITEIIADVEDSNMFMSGRKFSKKKDLFNSGLTFSQNELDTALLFFCFNGYIFLVLELLHLGADVQARDKHGNTPLLICAESGFTNIARICITRGVNINASNNVGKSALILAASLVGSVEMVKLLLAQTGINVNHQNNEGDTALMKVIESRNVDCSVEMVKLLLAQTGINKNHQNKKGYTALMMAIEDLEFNVIELLLDSDEKTIEGLEIKNHRSETAQDMADKFCIGRDVKFLIKSRTIPLVAAVLTCDMDSFNNIMDCHVYEPSYKKRIIQDSFKAMFKKHKKSRENFIENEEKMIEKLLENGAQVDDCPIFGPLRIAMNVGSCSVLTILLNHLENLNMLHNWVQKHLLEVSAKLGHANIVELLLTRNQNMAAKIITSRALGSARKNGHLGCVEMLTKHGASLVVKSDFESAVDDDDPVKLKYLLENFATEINHTVSAEAMNNFVVAAARRGHTEIIGILLDAGVNVNCVNSDKKTPLVEAKNVAVVNFLVERGAVVNMNITEHNKVYSPLQYVLSKYNDFAEKIEKVEALLKHGAFVNKNSHMGSPLMIAVLNMSKKIVHIKIVQLLLDHGADVSIKDSSGNTVLHIATKKDFIENLECLLKYSEVRNIINEKNHAGYTALMISTMFSHSAVKALIDHGADVNIKNNAGNNAVMFVVSSARGEYDILKTLIQAGSDISCQNDNGYSPLMLAVTASWKDAMVLLVDSGADVNTVCGKNKTALSLLLNDYDHICYVEYLLDHGTRASYARQNYILWLILQKQFHIIQKLIQCGLGPEEITLIKSCSNLPTSVEIVSPLYVALMTGNIKLANYFVENLFVTKSDMFTLIYHKDMRYYFHCLKLYDRLGFLDKQSAQPLSLFSLACLEVQSVVGTTPGREERISLLPLPLLIKDRLMFKAESGPLDLSDHTPTTSDEICSCVHTYIYDDKCERDRE